MDAPAPGLRVGIDTGGTFTDIVLADTRSGRLHVTKLPSTPENPAVALRQGIEEVLAATGRTPEELAAICHGTTVATNALLQGEIDDLALIVTSGFRHILEIARQSVPDGYGNSYFWVKPPRIVPLERVREVGGRMSFDGRELVPLAEDEIRQGVQAFARRGVDCVAVCFLHSYANPAHEERTADLLAELMPRAFVSRSSEVLPEYR